VRASHQMEMLHKPHVYVKRTLPNGTTVSGYEPVPEDVILPSAADLDAVAEELKAKEATAPGKPALVKPPIVPGKAVGK
jgi:hypothetical protein